MVRSSVKMCVFPCRLSTLGVAQIMKILRYTPLLIYIILVASFLVVSINIFIDYMNIPFAWRDTLLVLQDTLYNLWDRFSFALVSIVILINYKNLSKMNIDKNFLILYVTSGIVFGAEYFWTTGWIGFLCAGLIIYMLIRKKFNFEQRATLDSAKMVIILFAAFFLNWLYKITFIGKPAIGQYVMFYLLGLPFWVTEEVIIRGMLWMNLEALGWRPFQIVLVQSLIFWIFHIQYVLSNPFLFWLQTPFVSIFLGILVWKYKSITPSVIAHILFNLR